jgi:alpha-D-xyloside xylohydrolase
MTPEEQMYQKIPTRCLEDNMVLRAVVDKTKLVAIREHGVLLRTVATPADKRSISSADSDMMNQRERRSQESEVVGTLCIDFITDDCFRVRYCAGEIELRNDTAMVVGEFSGPRLFSVQENDEGLTVSTAQVLLSITHSPYRLEARDMQGKLLCGIGGAEKDYFNNWDAHNTGVHHSLEDHVPIATECFDLNHDESIYGLGEQFIAFDKVGQTIDLNTIDALGVTTPRSYKNVPFYVSNKGYGVFFNHSSLMTAWLGSMSGTDVQVAAHDDFLDYYVMTGSIKEVLARYTDITGKGSLPPKWTFGYWQSKISYSSAKEILEIASEMRKKEIPCDVIHLDTHWFKHDWYCDLQFDPERFPDVPGTFKELDELGFKVSLWQLPYIPEGSKLFDDLVAVDGFVKTKDDEIYNCGVCFTPELKGKSCTVGVVDYTNPAAVRVHQDAFRRLFKMGAKVIKTDFGEAAPSDGVYHDGTPGHQMHNLYPLLYNKAVAEVTEQETGDAVVWARSAWAGSQRYPLHWGGDNSPNHFNLYSQLLGGMSMGMSGFQFWSQDIGGFLGETNDALLCRWMQMGMFMSHARIHGCGDRELYKFSAQCQEICKKYIDLRYQLIPYIFSEAHDCVERSLPMLRPLVIEYQDDPTVRTIGDQYLFGSSLLVAPILSESDTRMVYLPAGTWTDWWSGELLTGARWLEVSAGLETMPIYIREGAIIPMGPTMNYIDEKQIDEYQIRLGHFSEGDRSKFTLRHGEQAVEILAQASAGQVEISSADSLTWAVVGASS